MKTLKIALLGIAASAALAQPVAAGTGTSVFFASIRSVGTIISGSGVSSSTKLDVGRYAVDFPRDVNTCVYTATPISGAAHKVVARVTSSNLKRILIGTFFSSATPQDVGFNLTVMCQD